LQSYKENGEKINMKAKTFRDLHVYQQARILSGEIYKITKQDLFSRDFRLVGQIQNASASVASNIAEGFERGSNSEFVQFLFIAKGSCGEVEAQLDLALDQKYINEDIYAELVKKCHLIRIMISNFIKYLKDTSIKKRNL
jgi:four helix bundle protein